MDQYGFVSRDSGSSVYKATAEYLLQERGHDWKRLPPNSSSFHLMFGERNKLPFGRLGNCFVIKIYIGIDGVSVLVLQNYWFMIKYTLNILS